MEIDETAENGVKYIPIVEWKEIGDKDTQIQYKGFVDDGFPEGKGVMTFPEGQKYVGEFKDGIFHGQGTYTFPNGKKNVGK